MRAVAARPSGFAFGGKDEFGFNVIIAIRLDNIIDDAIAVGVTIEGDDVRCLANVGII